MSTSSTTNLRVVSRNLNPDTSAPAASAKNKPSLAEHRHRSRKALLRMALAAAAAPILWLVHALAQQLHHSF